MMLAETFVLARNMLTPQAPWARLLLSSTTPTATGGVLLGATLTAAKGIGLIYLNKGIINGATALGGIFGPGGAVVGFIVGVVASIVVDIFLDNWLDELIDNLAT